MVDHASAEQQEHIAASILKRKIAQETQGQGMKTSEIELKTMGSKMWVAVNPVEKKTTFFQSRVSR